MKIGNRLVGFGEPTFVIAELCSNVIHYLEYDGLETCIRAVSKTGAHSAKIQLFKAGHFPRAEWESKKRVEFPRDRVEEFVNLCHKHNLLAGASVFDDEAVELLERCGADYIKVATREEENLNLWMRVLESPLPKIASFDCEKNLAIPHSVNTIQLACIPQYPVIDPKLPTWLEYGDPMVFGWSSHTPDYLDCLIAVSRGACVVEKHIAFSEHDYEAGWSLLPKQFGEMVRDVKRVERMR